MIMLQAILSSLPGTYGDTGNSIVALTFKNTTFYLKLVFFLKRTKAKVSKQNAKVNDIIFK